MVGLLKRLAAAWLGVLATGGVVAAAPSDRQTWTVSVDVGHPAASSPLEPWTAHGFGKLRFGEDSGLAGNRLAVEYDGRLSETFWAHVVADYVDDASSGPDVTEAYVRWRPVPRSELQQQLRVGAFYPPFSLENRDSAWTSPYSTSFSAINTWLGEEIRPLGAEWSLRRRLGPNGSPHELMTFVSGFVGNDPAGTLLFWRGFALHARQSRLNDRLPMPPSPIFGPGGVVGLREQNLEPIAEIDDSPGFYAGVEWRYGRRALLQIATYDNRADPNAFRAGQWAWQTRFHHVAMQIELPHDFALVSQWMEGSTRWLIAAAPTGERTPATTLVRDDFDSAFLLLTKRIGDSHRLSLRHDVFDMSRSTGLGIDSGHAWTLAYEYTLTNRLALACEWLQIESERDVWPLFYALPAIATETQTSVALTYRMHSGTAR